MDSSRYIPRKVVPHATEQTTQPASTDDDLSPQLYDGSARVTPLATTTSQPASVGASEVPEDSSVIAAAKAAVASFMGSAQASTFTSTAAAAAAAAMIRAAQIGSVPPPALLGTPAWEEALHPAYDYASLARPGGLAALAPPVVIMPSAVTQLPLQSGSMVLTNMGGGPAAAAALLGPAGLPGMLAATPVSRVLTVLNAITDVDLSSKSTLLDVLTDVACEAQECLRAREAAAVAATESGKGSSSSPGGLGHLIRALTPLPRKGEALEPRTLRAKGALKHVGADGMLEDGKVHSGVNDDDCGDRGGAGRVEGDVDMGSGSGSSKRGANSEALVLAAEPSTSGLGQASRNKIATVAADFFKRLGGGFSEHIVNLPGAGQTGGFASFTPAPPSAESTDSAGAPSSTSQNAEGQRQPGNEEEAGSGKPARTRGLGRIYLEFSTKEACVAAGCALSGRFFAGRILVVSFVEEVAFCNGSVVSLSEDVTIPPGAGVFCSEEYKECGSLVIVGPALSTA